jgi:hypothetical protein
MNIIKKHVAVIALSTIALFGFTACATPAASTPDPEASVATVEETTEPSAEVTTPPPVNELIKQFGEVVTYEDGLSISLSAPIPFSPGEYAQGAVDGQTPIVFKVVLTNNTAEAVDPYTYVSVSSAGAESAVIGDYQNPEYGDIGLSPTTKVLPGQTVEWYVGYSIADPANITAEVQTGFAYDSAIFTNIPF